MVSADQMFQVNAQAVVRDYYVEPRIGACVTLFSATLWMRRKGDWENGAPSPCSLRSPCCRGDSGCS